MKRSRRINFDWQIGLIGLSALFGLMIAYSRQAAAVQFVIVVLSIIVYLMLANISDPVTLRGRPRSVLSIMMAALPAAITVLFLLTNNWSRTIGKVPALDPVLRELAAGLPAAGADLNPNIAGGSLAALLPLQIFALRRTRLWISVPLIALTLFGLILSQTRGAWLALILVSGMWLMWTAITKRVADKSRARRWWIAVVAGCGAVLIGLLFLTSLGDRLLDLGGDRRAIWHNSVDLISDYPITGLGLAGFEMAYSTYTLLIHVGHTMHAHNLWLDMWLNQGIIGVMALAGMVLNAIWPKSSSTWRMPSLLTLSVILLHSLVDDPYYGYGGAALPIVFIPLGLLARSGSMTSSESMSKRSRFQPAFVMWSSAAVLLVVGFLMPPGRAAVEANLGALAQSYTELSKYSWPEVPIQDALRRLDGADLSSVVAHYQTALAIDPANATANRRLGQIELAREQFDAACEHLAAAYQAMPQQRAAIQLLGECYALNDQPNRAVELWRTLDTSAGQLTLRHWWYETYLGDSENALRLNRADLTLSSQQIAVPTEH